MNLSETERVQLANNVRNTRTRCNLSREELSHFSGIDYADILRIETGELIPDIKTIERIYFTLGMPLTKIP